MPKWKYPFNGFRLIAQLTAATPATPHTGTVAETDIWSFTIPGGILKPQCSLFLDHTWTLNGNAGTKTVRCYYGAFQFAFPIFAASATANYAAHMVNGFDQNAANAQVSHALGNSATTPFGAFNATLLTGTVDSALDQTFRISATLANAADSAQLRGARVWLAYSPSVKLN